MEFSNCTLFNGSLFFFLLFFSRGEEEERGGGGGGNRGGGGSLFYLFFCGGMGQGCCIHTFRLYTWNTLSLSG